MKLTAWLSCGLVIDPAKDSPVAEYVVPAKHHRDIVWQASWLGGIHIIDVGVLTDLAVDLDCDDMFEFARAAASAGCEVVHIYEEGMI